MSHEKAHQGTREDLKEDIDDAGSGTWPKACSLKHAGWDTYPPNEGGSILTVGEIGVGAGEDIGRVLWLAPG